MTNLLVKGQFECRVSSVLNSNVKSYGKQFMFNSDNDTCWNSESGSPQWVLISFHNEVEVASIEIQFQGGFAGQKCRLEVGSDSKSLQQAEDIYPEDINSTQIFKLKGPTKGQVFRIIFENSTDFFGRIIIYKLAFYS